MQDLQNVDGNQCCLDGVYERLVSVMMSGLREVNPKPIKGNKWYTKSLAKMRKDMRKAEASWLHEGSKEVRKKKRRSYLEKRRMYSKAVSKAKRDFEEGLRCQLENNLDNSKHFWNVVGKVGLNEKNRSKVNVKEAVDGNGCTVTGEDAIQVWKNYFESLLNGGISQADETLECSNVPDSCHLSNLDYSNQLNGLITLEEVEWALHQVNSEVSPGADGVSIRMMSANVLRNLWVALFNECWVSGMVPKMWRKGLIVPVPKSHKAGACVPDNFRGISLTSVVCKVFCLILKERLAVVAEENGLLANEQGGFRKGRGCPEQIVSLILLAQTQMALKPEGMLAAFIDFEKAYDWVDRQKLWKCLWQNGVRGRFLGFLKALYFDSRCQVKLLDVVSDEFGVGTGLRQGCVLSPLLFSLYINSLVVELKNEACGVSCRGSLVPGLLYADDTSLFGEDAIQLKRGLLVLEKWCNEWGVRINVMKSGIVHFRSKGVKRCAGDLAIQGQHLPFVSSYKYLGCEVDEYLEMKLMQEQRVEKGKLALNVLLQKCRSVGDVYSGTFKKLMESMVHSVLLYGAEAWGLLKRMDSLEQLQLRALRTYFGVGRNHPRVSLLAEMSCFPLMWEARLRCVVFWFKILLSPMFENRIICRAAKDAISVSRGPWLNNLKDVLTLFGWSDVSGQSLQGMSWHEVKRMLSDIAQRKVLESWRKEMVERPKLSVLHAIHSLGDSISPMCADVQSKIYRRVLMQLRGGTAHFRIETGRWRQIPRELRVCRECSSGDIEDLNHWLLHCSAWQTSRFPLMKKMMEQYIDFPTLNDEAKVVLILTAACRSPAIMKKIYTMWTDRFCS